MRLLLEPASGVLPISINRALIIGAEGQPSTLVPSPSHPPRELRQKRRQNCADQTLSSRWLPRLKA